MSIFMYLIVIFGVIIGGGSTLVIVLMLFGTLGYKIYRKIKYGMSLYD
jgi:hypothetical protein